MANTTRDWRRERAARAAELELLERRSTPELQQLRRAANLRELVAGLRAGTLDVEAMGERGTIEAMMLASTGQTPAVVARAAGKAYSGPQQAHTHAKEYSCNSRR